MTANEAHYPGKMAPHWAKENVGGYGTEKVGLDLETADQRGPFALLGDDDDGHVTIWMRKKHELWKIVPYEQEAMTMWQHKQSISYITVWDVLQMMMGAFLSC